MVADRGGFLGRADDVGEEHRGKHAVDRDGRTRAGQKLLDRIGDVAGIVADEGEMVDPRELEIARAWNMRGEKATALDADVPVVRPVDDGGIPVAAARWCSATPIRHRHLICRPALKMSVSRGKTGSNQPTADMTRVTPQRKWSRDGLADRNFAAKATQRKGLQSRRS